MSSEVKGQMTVFKLKYDRKNDGNDTDAHIAQRLKLGLPMASRLQSGQPTSPARMDHQREIQ